MPIARRNEDYVLHEMYFVWKLLATISLSMFMMMMAASLLPLPCTTMQGEPSGLELRKLLIQIPIAKKQTTGLKTLLLAHIAHTTACNRLLLDHQRLTAVFTLGILLQQHEQNQDRISAGRPPGHPYLIN
jgi:hypothetical protein